MMRGLSLVLILMATPCLAETSAGIAQLSEPAGRERPLSLSIWYPSDGPASTTVGGNAVFQGVGAAAGAPLPAGPLPLVVVSHGGLRSAADSGAWLSASLARSGYVAVEVNAPRPRDAADALDEIWQRPQDIGRALDLLLGAQEWKTRIDRDRIAVVGFALGATAALSVAGADIDVGRYWRACAGDTRAETPDCAWYAAEGVRLAQTDMEGLGRRWRDRRFGAAVAIEPEYRSALDSSAVTVPTLLLSLGSRPGDAGSVRSTGRAVVDGAAIAAIAIGDIAIADAFAPCTAAGRDILVEEDGDASLCGASPDAREQAHRAIAAAVVSHLAQAVQ